VTLGSPLADSLQRFVRRIRCAHLSACGAARESTFRSTANGRICGSSGLQGRCPGTSPEHFSASPCVLDARTHLRFRWCAMRCDFLRGSRHTERVQHGARTLVDSAVFCFTAPLLDLLPGARRSPKRQPPPAIGPRGPYDQGARTSLNKSSYWYVRPTLMTLTPTLPSRPDPRDSAIKPNLLSWDFQRPPLHRLQPESSLFQIVRLRPILGTSCRSSRAPHCGFSPPLQLPSSTSQVYCTLLPIMGFIPFHFVAKRSSSRCSSCPSKPSPHRKRSSRRLSVASRRASSTSRSPPLGERERHRWVHFWPSVHRSPCPPALSLRHVRRRLLVFPTAVSRS